MDIANLKAVLASELDKEGTDFNEILKLANEIVKHDIDNVRFSIDASHITRLGHELVSKQETAVAELVKNAYDADATLVHVIFKNASNVGGDLIVEDNGVGMNRDHLINGFMRISTQDKSKNPLSIRYSRQRAGRKGIGRFSAQRLGKHLEILTKCDDAEVGLCVSIDWNKFDQAGDLILVSSQIRDCDGVQSGTKLQIGNLKDSWSNAQIQRAYRYITDLLQPIPLPFSPVKSDQDPGFKVEFYEEVYGQKYLVASEEKNILAHAYAEISGYVDEKGQPFFSISSEKYNIHIKNEEFRPDDKVKTVFESSVNNYLILGGVSFKAHYFMEGELPAGTRNVVRNVLKNNGGIRIYRNGFRVLPYGEPKDDWLGLQRSSALRQLLPPHHNSNFLGFVQLSDVNGVNFEETASREGLIENSAFEALQDYIYKALMHGVIKIAHARNKKVFSGDPPKKKKPASAAFQLAGEIKDLVDTLNDRSLFEGSSSNRPAMGGVAVELAGKVKELEEVSHAILEENGMLRVLASLGLTIGEFTHETRHILTALSASVLELASARPSELVLNSLRDNIESLQSYMRYFDKAVTQNAQRNLNVHELRDLIGDFRKIVSSALKRQHVSLEVEVDGYDLFVKPSHKSEWASVFFNLFTNSLKAINRAKVSGKILIKAGEVDDKTIYVEFVDNGDGISEINKDKVFDAFFTTTSPADALADDEVQVTGSGLGLKIIKDIVEDAGGDIFIVNPPVGYSTNVRIEFPRAADEEIPDELR